MFYIRATACVSETIERTSMAIQDMTTAAPPATTDMPHPLAVALKHHVSPSLVHVETREEPERAAGGATCSLRLRCTLTSSYEKQLIGAPAPEVEDEEGPTVYESSLDNVDLRNHDACHAAVLKLLSVLPISGPVSLLSPAAGEWYKPVLRDMVGQVQHLVTTSGEGEARGYALDVSLSIQEIITYVQPEALMLACEHAAAAIPASPLAPDERCVVCIERFPVASPDDDARPQVVCTEDDNKAFTLPACRHTFHRGCVAAWFKKASTCPLCRCDMMHCLIAVQKQFGLR
ncbi:unnamed protein product [Alopecurus aequalis]